MTLRRYGAPYFLAGAILVFSFALPVFVHADTQADVRAAIMTEVLNDPRVADIPPEQLNALIDALAAQAEVQSVTAADILWHPDDYKRASLATQANVGYFTQCEQDFMILCPFNTAFGFAGTESNIPAWLLVLSAVLLLLLPRLRAHHEGAGLSNNVGAGTVKQLHFSHDPL